MVSDFSHREGGVFKTAAWSLRVWAWGHSNLFWGRPGPIWAAWVCTWPVWADQESAMRSSASERTGHGHTLTSESNMIARNSRGKFDEIMACGAGYGVPASGDRKHYFLAKSARMTVLTHIEGSWETSRPEVQYGAKAENTRCGEKRNTRGGKS